MITVGGFLENRRRRVSPPRMPTSSSLTILTTCWAGLRCPTTSATGRPLADARGEVAHDGQGDVGVEQRAADLPHGRVDVGFGQPPLAAQRLERGGEAVGERGEHATTLTGGASGPRHLRRVRQGLDGHGHAGGESRSPVGSARYSTSTAWAAYVATCAERMSMRSVASARPRACSSPGRSAQRTSRTVARSLAPGRMTTRGCATSDRAPPAGRRVCASRAASRSSRATSPPTMRSRLWRSSSAEGGSPVGDSTHQESTATPSRVAHERGAHEEAVAGEEAGEVGEDPGAVGRHDGDDEEAVDLAHVDAGLPVRGRRGGERLLGRVEGRRAGRLLPGEGLAGARDEAVDQPGPPRRPRGAARGAGVRPR